MTLLTLLLIFAVIAHMAQSIKLAGSIWMIHHADGTIEYKNFVTSKTMAQYIKRESGEVHCRRYIYQIGSKKKTNSILNVFTSTYANQHSIASSSLIHKKSEEWLNEEFVSSGLNVSWTRVDSIPHNSRCYKASYAVTAQPLNIDIYPTLYSIDNVGLVVRSNDYVSLYYAVNELNGYNLTITDPPPALPDVGFSIWGGVAVSESIWMFIRPADLRGSFTSNDPTEIVKYDVVSGQILAISKTITSIDLAISPDKSTVYYATAEEGTIHALSSGDLSMLRSYSISQFPVNQGTQYIQSIKVTSTAMWIYINFEGSRVRRNPLARVTLSEDFV